MRTYCIRRDLYRSYLRN